MGISVRDRLFLPRSDKAVLANDETSLRDEAELMAAFWWEKISSGIPAEGLHKEIWKYSIHNMNLVELSGRDGGRERILSSPCRSKPNINKMLRLHPKN